MIETLIAFLLALPHVEIETSAAAREHIDAAQAAATDRFPAAILLAIGWEESRLRMSDQSVATYGNGVAKRCGPGHANSYGSARRCAWLKRPFGAYRAVRDQLERRMREDMPGQPMAVILAGFGCKVGRHRMPRCTRYAARVLDLSGRISAQGVSP